MKRRKKILAWILTMAMVCTSLNVMVFAAADSDPMEAPEIVAEDADMDAVQPVVGEAVEEDPNAAEGTIIEEGPIADEGDEPSGYPESDHNYANSYENTWTYTLDGAGHGVYVTFDKDTNTESGYDFIYIYDGEDKEIGKYSGTALASATVYVPTATFKIRLTSDQSSNAWGFKVTAVEACGETIDLEKVGSVDDISPVECGGTPNIVVRANGIAGALDKETDYTVLYDTSQAGSVKATITGEGKYSGTFTADFDVFDEDHLVVPEAKVNEAKISLRQTADWSSDLTSYGGASGYFQLVSANNAYLNAIESVTLKPVESTTGELTTAENLEYPYAPKEIELTQEDKGTWAEKNGKWFVDGSSVRFYRTSADPVVYVIEGHEPLEITGRRTVIYPQSQRYEITVDARGYEPITGYVTYYTGTSPEFSIIVDEDGDAATTDDQKTVKTWTSKEIEEKATFANGSSQCGMTGFRTFSGMGVSLKDLLEEAGVEVSDDDYFLLDTSDHYGNNFTYDALFNTTRYFMESIYTDQEVQDTYHELVKSDDEAGATLALRQLLAKKALAAGSTVEPRINVTYDETLIYGDDVGTVELPSKDNMKSSTLVSYENQYRFFYGIAIDYDEFTVTFDTGEGSEVKSQLVKGNPITSTENTTIKSSYWANSLVIYRGAGEEHKTEASEAADSIRVPETPTREGYVFDGWYTDAEYTSKFDFTANFGMVDEDTTLYAKWIPEEKTPTTPTVTPPAAPGKAKIKSAVSASYKSVKITWGKVTNATGYIVSRATKKGGTYTTVKTINNAKTLSYTDNGLTAGKTYYYKVQAIRKVGNDVVKGTLSAASSAKPVPAKAAISSTKRKSAKKAVIRWKKVSGANGYIVYRAASKNGKYKAVKTIKSGSKLTYTDSGLTKNKAYYYKVRAYRTVSGNKVNGTLSAAKKVKKG